MPDLMGAPERHSTTTAASSSDAPRVPRLAALITLVIGAALLVVTERVTRGLFATDVLDSATGVLIFDVAAVAAICVAAMLLPARWRAMALVPGAAVLAASIAGAATFGRHADDLLAALLIVGASWQLGSWLVSRITPRRIGDPILTELTVGGGAFGIVTLLFGRLGIIEPWTLGLFTVVIGGLGLVRLGATSWRARSAAANAIVGSRLAAAATGICALHLGLVGVWLSAPEIMFDALYSKTYLPELWANSGRIGPLTEHPHLNIMGLASIAATVGHVFGADDVGRWLQFLALPGLAAALWRFAGTQSAVGPIVAVLLVTAPQLSWQAATAYDDILIALAIAALAIAVAATIAERSEFPADWRASVVIGLIAGTAIWLKLHTLVLAAVLLAGGLLAAGPAATFLPRAIGAGIGTLSFAATPMVLRWIDTGNPLFPSYNNIFKSPHYLPIDERFDQPYWPDAQLTDIVRLPQQLLNAAPNFVLAAPGEYTALVGAIGAAILVGWWRGRPSVVWTVAIVAALIFWWANFRYARYLIPVGTVGLLVVILALRDWSPGFLGTALAIGVTGLSAAISLPTLVSAFWNVPNRTIPLGAAYGRWDREDYLRTVFPVRNALQAYERLAPAGANAISAPHQRTFVRDRDLFPLWEAQTLLARSGPVEGDVFKRLRRLGIDWAIVTDTTPPAQRLPWEQTLIERHMQILFADRGFSVARLVDRPSYPTLRRNCDPSLRGVASCWTGLDGKPGIAPGEAAQSWRQTCPGQLVAIRVKIAGKGEPTNVLLDADGDATNIGHSPAVVPPDGTRWVYATMPPRATRVNVLINAGAGTMITAADFASQGTCPAAPPSRAASTPR